MQPESEFQVTDDATILRTGGGFGPAASYLACCSVYPVGGRPVSLRPWRTPHRRLSATPMTGRCLPRSLWAVRRPYLLGLAVLGFARTCRPSCPRKGADRRGGRLGGFGAYLTGFFDRHRQPDFDRVWYRKFVHPLRAWLTVFSHQYSVVSN